MRGSVRSAKNCAELRRRQHPLVDDRARRQRREVGVELVDELATRPLAGDERLAVEIDTGGPVGIGHEQLLERRHRRSRRCAEAVGVDRQVAPAEHLQTDLGHGRVDRRLRLLARDVVGRAGMRCRSRRRRPAAGRNRRPPGRGRRRPAAGCPRRHPCRVRHRWHHGARGSSAPSARSRRARSIGRPSGSQRTRRRRSRVRGVGRTDRSGPGAWII